MKARTLAIAILAIFLITPALSAQLDKNYKSYELMQEKTEGGRTIGYYRFRLNIPLAMEYMRERLKWSQEMAEKSKGTEYYTAYTNNIGYYRDNLAKMTSGKELKGVRMFGDFNSWYQQALGDNVYELIPSRANPQTYYTQKLVPFRKYRSPRNNRYKFILDYGEIKLADGSVTDNFAYVEDPLSGDNKGDDGFGGFNSFFTY
jgi:hypothetical protein